MPRKEPSATAAFDHAIEVGDVANAWLYAHDLARVSAYRALRLTILLGLEAGRNYEAAARRFLRLFIHECRPSLSLLELTAHALKVLGEEDEGMLDRNDARDGLLKLAEHINKQEPERWDGNIGPQY